MNPAPPPPDPAPAETVALAPVHDFVRKLRQAPFHDRVRTYVAWRRAVLAARSSGAPEPPMPPWAPLSINLDLTTACNFACDHCIDWDILNSGVSHDETRLRATLASMAGLGLRSVILIGGGEPTVYPGFTGVVRYLKDLGLQVAIVSNGSRNERILDVADDLDAGDWVRLSLDAGTDPTFQAMHKPKKPITLEAICAGIAPIKARNPAPRIGFSFVICWSGAHREAGAPPITENVDEIPRAARLARDSGFDYISFKPVLTRAPDGAEVMDPGTARLDLDRVLARIRAGISQARTLQGPSFAVLESTNLRVLERGDWQRLTRQPSTCHMQVLRQVLSPQGLWNCPAHRGVPKARIDGPDAFADADGNRRTAQAVAGILDRFDAAHECREVTCLYNDANWWIERAVQGPGELEGLRIPDEGDAFL